MGNICHKGTSNSFNSEGVKFSRVFNNHQFLCRGGFGNVYQVALKSKAPKEILDKYIHNGKSLSIDEIDRLNDQVDFIEKTIHDNLEDHNFENPNLENSNLENHKLENSNLENHKLENSNLENSNLENPNLENPNLDNHDVINDQLFSPHEDQYEQRFFAIKVITKKTSKQDPKMRINNLIDDVKESLERNDFEFNVDREYCEFVLEKLLRDSSQMVYKTPVEKITSEIQILKKCQRHPNIINILDVFENEKFMTILMPRYYRGFGIRAPYKPKIVAIWMKQLFSAISHIHSLGYVHRDIKPDNLMFTCRKNSMHIVLTDFGLTDTPIINSSDKAGTVDYMAPEIFVRDEQSFPSDIWSIGCTIFFLLVGSTPSSLLANRRKKDKKIKKSDYRLPEGSKFRSIVRNGRERNIPDEDKYYMYDGFQTSRLICSMMDKKLMENITDLLSTYIDHVKMKDLLFKILIVEPTERLAGIECLRHESLKDLRMQYTYLSEDLFIIYLVYVLLYNLIIPCIYNFITLSSQR